MITCSLWFMDKVMKFFLAPQISEAKLSHFNNKNKNICHYLYD